jgi:prepilin signal peptidase PulO-like enzyme (type II secretory pathway)
MVFETIIITICLVGLVIGTVTDAKTREVPDWVSYSLIAIGFGLRLIVSVIKWDIRYILEGMLGFLVFLLISLIMFYGGQWGGGDSKMIMALGALLGLQFKIDNLMVALFINIIIVGSVYGLVWSAILAIKNWKKFVRRAKALAGKREFIRIRKVFLILSLMIIIVAFPIEDLTVKIPLLVISLLLFFTLYIWIFIKAVEDSCMFKLVEVEKLTEGDWVAQDIVVKGKKVIGAKNLGVTKKQISELIELKKRGRIDKVLIKEGVPFIPSFLIAFIVSLIWGNLVLLIV